MEKVKVMIAGFGKMSTLIAKAILASKDMELIPVVLYKQTGTGNVDGFKVSLIDPQVYESAIKAYRPDIIIDFTVPSVVNKNAELYCKLGVPFVMGATGGNRELLCITVENSKISAVIAPNMAEPIVAFLAMLKYAAENFPEIFRGYRLSIKESHQKGKKDTSGTAKLTVRYFNNLGIPFTENQIIMERRPFIQWLFWRVPIKFLKGHAYHIYTVYSEKGDVLFQFKYCINGRDVYIKGAMSAIRFLSKTKEKGKVFDIIDVLKGA